MNRIELSTKFPRHLIKNEPLKDCPTCGGEGRFVSRKLGSYHPCLCACLSETDDKLRRAAIIAFKNSIASLKP